MPFGTATPNTWTEPPAKEWLVRGPEYLKQSGTNVLSLKQPSAETPYQCIGINVFRASYLLDHTAEKVQAVKEFLSVEEADEDPLGLPTFLIVDFMFSNFFKTEYTSVQHMFKRTSKSSGEDEHLDAAVRRFMRADDEGKNEQLKYMFKVVEGPPMMLSAVAALGGERPVIIGRKLTTKYFQRKNYLEIGEWPPSRVSCRRMHGLTGSKQIVMDVGSSVTASMLNTVSFASYSK